MRLLEWLQNWYMNHMLRECKEDMDVYSFPRGSQLFDAYKKASPIKSDRIKADREKE
jgi:hypothetical protein